MFLIILIVSSVFIFPLLQRSWLSIDNNLLSGTIPQFTSSMHDLKYFTINSNFLGGTIPLALGDQKKITHLGLGNNDFVGTFPRNFETVTSLGKRIGAMVISAVRLKDS